MNKGIAIIAVLLGVTTCVASDSFSLSYASKSILSAYVPSQQPVIQAQLTHNFSQGSMSLWTDSTIGKSVREVDLISNYSLTQNISCKAIGMHFSGTTLAGEFALQAQKSFKTPLGVIDANVYVAGVLPRKGGVICKATLSHTTTIGTDLLTLSSTLTAHRQYFSEFSGLAAVNLSATYTHAFTPNFSGSVSVLKQFALSKQFQNPVCYSFNMQKTW